MAGFINRLYFNTIGGVVKSGEPLLEITPSDGALAVEARVRPDDRASLRPGLPTRVLIGAYDYAVYGALEGKLVEVSADTLPDEHGLATTAF
jgi:adhesin transport system membrane fusion protein